MSLQAEALLAQTGIRRKDPVTMAHAQAAILVPVEFDRRLKRFLRTVETAPFDPPEPLKDRDRLFTELTQPTSTGDIEILLLNFQDMNLAAEYQVARENARGYLVDHWPRFSIDSLTGPQTLPLSNEDWMQAWSLYYVVNDPVRIFDDLDQLSLTAAQVDAFRAVYPALAKMVDDLLIPALADMATKKDFELRWDREAVLRTLLAVPLDTPIVIAEPQGPNVPAPGDFKISYKFQQTTSERTLTPGETSA